MHCNKVQSSHVLAFGHVWHACRTIRYFSYLSALKQESLSACDYGHIGKVLCVDIKKLWIQISIKPSKFFPMWAVMRPITTTNVATDC